MDKNINKEIPGRNVGHDGFTLKSVFSLCARLRFRYAVLKRLSNVQRRDAIAIPSHANPKGFDPRDQGERDSLKRKLLTL